MLRLVDPAVAMFPAHGTSLSDPWSHLSQCSTLQSAVEQVAEIYEFQWHPYFIWMQSISSDRGQFVRSQVPFQYAIEAFSQAFVMVFDRAEMTQQAAEPSIIQPSNNAPSPPQLAFQRCLQSLETRADLAKTCPIEIAAANHHILNHCLTQSVESGAALLGMIEYLYVDISATISQIIQQRDWADCNSDFYYMIHEALEINPNRDLLTLANRTWHDPQSRRQTAQSLMLGAQYLWEMYDGLYPDPLD
ncbi:hypothetical protein IQ266_16860 [filamentous cyanobacterium LEGE 11480]|uniref:Uncharacterized protein n=1 Tax=Romeriopsis navalis LEGE 11480 TaxID=2777977 RepID=A0A928VPK2_9CYAN|nr:hypothetical protein [Romeriopsis navalis]MBE9031407.1 hypothetical protein [Romeriopsis navalis LEGE 11480]